MRIVYEKIDLYIRHG